MKETKYIQVILPLALPKVYTYLVADELMDHIQIGVRVEVPLKNRRYAGLITAIHVHPPDYKHQVKSIITVIDKTPIVGLHQLKFWKWIAQYYCCTIGEVMNIALPSGLKLSSETKLVINNHEYQADDLSDKEFLIAEAVSIRDELSIAEIQDVIEQKTYYPHIRKLLEDGIVSIKEELQEKYKPKLEDYIEFEEPYQSNKDELVKALELTTRSEKQTRAILALTSLSNHQKSIQKKTLFKAANVDNSVVKALVKKNIIKVESKQVSRIKSYEGEQQGPGILSKAQVEALAQLEELYVDKSIALLFGVTGSGKTRIYIEYIQSLLNEGKQILYLVPEIALTTQLVSRLESIFGKDIGVYHSRMNNNERVELYQKAQHTKGLFIGARSSLFLPFQNLGLIIVDEEHDPSYKQSDPTPRYHARDAAIYLSQIVGAKVLLGSATPSLETMLNVKENKYGLVTLTERYGESVLPEIQIVNLANNYKKNEMQGRFSLELIEAMKLAIDSKEQILLFQNRRGYATTLHCGMCGWSAGCVNCDVSLTVHQYFNELRCHYCHRKEKLPKACPHCGNDIFEKLGFGTERIEDELKEFLPNAKIKRLDFDTARTKSNYESILHSFETGDVDILVGTQMITKGLDFDNVAIVGVMLADKSLFFPDFRANERAFQLFTQVSGRAGRRKKQGKVIIQTFNPLHPVIQETISYDINRHINRELEERKSFIYPPYYRMIELTLRHKKFPIVNEAAIALTNKLKTRLDNRVKGPITPGIARIRGFYIQKLIIKMEKDNKVNSQIKQIIQQYVRHIKEQQGMSGVRISIDVDP